MTYAKQFRNYQIQEARIERTRYKKLAELLRLQAERRANESEAAETADSAGAEDDLSDMDALSAKYAPALQAFADKQNLENGFVFSNGSCAQLQR